MVNGGSEFVFGGVGNSFQRYHIGVEVRDLRLVSLMNEVEV